MGQSSNRPTTPPTVEARFAHDSEKMMSATLRPLRLKKPSVPDEPASSLRLVTQPSPVPEALIPSPRATPPSAPRLASSALTRPSPSPSPMTDEEWAVVMVGTLRVTLGYDELKKLELDHRAGFLLSLMDASLDLETLVDLSGMSRGEVLEIVRGFYEEGVVEFR